MDRRNLPEPVELFWSRWREAATVPVIDAAITDLYKRLDEAVAARSPTCWVSGRCCNFDTFKKDFKMFVTGLEIAWVLSKLPQDNPALADWPARLAPDAACPFQVHKLCSVHAIRPLGCRVFFCQEGTQDWQQDVYEAFLADLRRLHEEHNIEYRYMEWRKGLISATDQRESIESIG
ncbi:MAG: hypothetical protein WD768_19145 [Phycisphaeraceae bacterium]